MRLLRFGSALSGAAMVSALVLSGCASASPRVETVSVYAVEPQGPLIPAETDDLAGYRILHALFDGLVDYDASGDAENVVAESITPNDDNTVYTVVIGDSRFTSGEAVTSDSFVNAWDWAANVTNHMANRNRFSGIVGYSQNEPASLVEAGGLVVVDRHTFEIHLTQPTSDLRVQLGHTAFYPMPTAYFEDRVAFGEHPIGNGPYMFDGDNAWKPGEHLELAVNAAYRGPRAPANDGVTMRFYDSLETAYADLLTGNLDVLDTLPTGALKSFEDEVDRNWVSRPLANLESLVIPASLPHFSGPEGLLRRAAISQAIDREAIVDDLYAASRVSAQDFTSPAYDGWSETLRGSELLRFDAEAAVTKWAQADELSPWDGTFEIAYLPSASDPVAVDAVAASIADTLGIQVVSKQVVTMPVETSEGEFPPAYIVNWNAEYPGVLGFIAPQFSKDGKANYGEFSNPDFEALLKSGSTAETLVDSRIEYRSAQELLLTELPALPLWNSVALTGYWRGVDQVALDWQGVPIYHLIAKHPE